MKSTVYHRQGLRLLDAINFSIVYILRSGMTCEFAGHSDPPDKVVLYLNLPCNVNSNWVHPPGQPRGLAQKTCPGGRDLTFESGPGIRQGPGFCGK